MPKYPPFFSTVAHHSLEHVRGPLLAAAFAVFLFNHDAAFPALISWLRTESTTAAAAAHWIATTLPTKGKDPYDILIYVFGTCAVHLVMYLFICVPLFLCDMFGWWQQHKLPRKSFMVPTKQLIISTFVDAVVGQLVIQPITLYLIYVYVADFRSYFTVAGGAVPLSAPDLVHAFVHFAGAALFNEFFFYVAHRVFHEVTWLYQNIHKKHHKYQGTIGFAAEYAHPLEQALANQMPTAGYCLLMSNRIHPTIWLVWIGWRLWETYEAHSGYCFENTRLSKMGLLHAHRARWHDFHHTVNQGNYGSHLFDYLFRSMDVYLEHQEKEAAAVASAKTAAASPLVKKRPPTTSPVRRG